MLRRGTDYDGHWSVSVAESPYDPHSYSIYIKTPTHNLTLTRTAAEIIDLDHKFRNAYPIPDLPSNLPLPPKRKSTFLNTLSRLASPASAKHNRRPTAAAVDPDVFSSLADDAFAHNPPKSTAAVPPPSATATALAAYLTSLANMQSVRADRVWKRFVRVRTDDLESVRVERAIKRVRSDLAAHSVKVDDGKLDHPVPISTQSQAHTQPTSDHPPSSVLDGRADHDEEDSSTFPSTPLASSPRPPIQPIMPRSQSADPDKSHRISRAFIPDLVDESQTTTGDESSFIAHPTLLGDFPSINGNGSVSAIASATITTSESGSAKRRKKGRKSDASRSTNKKSKPHRKVCIDDFAMLRVLGKGCAGKVLLVRHKPTSDLFAMKAITKRHVLAHQELQHTLTEQAVLRRMAAENKDPFVVRLWWSFHDKENLFLVMDFHPGGDLATQLARWGRLGRDRARFYAAEIVEGVEGLHAAGVIYRDLKPENILIGGDGHIVLTDFGLSKEFPRAKNNHPVSPGLPGGHAHAHGPNGSSFYSSVPGTPQPTTPPWMKPDRNGEIALGWGWPGPPNGIGGSTINGTNTSDITSTFCGTAEYLAPEVIQGLPYGYEVDWWSFGTMLYEMLTGITPFWANNHSDMYVRVLQDELQFPDDRAIDQDTKSLIRGLLQRIPSLRICEPRIKKHPYFSMIDWSHVFYKRYIPPYIPPIDPSNASDTQNFDDTFLDMEPVLDQYREEEAETEGTEPENEFEAGRRLDNGALTDVDTDQEPHTDGVDTEDGRTGTGTDVDEEHGGTPSQSRSSSIRPTTREKECGVNGSPVAGKNEEDVDVFDGYSFKGRHSVLLEDEEEGDGDGVSSSESSYEEGEAEAMIRGEMKGPKVVEAQDKDTGVLEEEEEEPKTPEARRVELPAVPETQPVVKDIGEVGEQGGAVTSKLEHEMISVEGAVDGHVGGGEDTVQIGQAGIIEPPPVPPKPTVPIPGLLTITATTAFATTPPTTATATPIISTTTPPGMTTAHRPRTRKERSGIPALDRYLSDTVEERSCASDASASENEGSEDEDEDWDLVEAADGEDRNGLGIGGVGARVGRGVGVGMRVKMKGGSLFARGVVDRYRLKVFGNKSGGSSGVSESSSGLNTQSRGRRVVSGMSVVSGRSFGSSTLGGGGSLAQKKEQKEKEKQKEKEERRGRTPLTFRKHPREFLRAKSPKGSNATAATTATSMTSVLAGGSSPSGSHTVPVSAASSLAGILLTPSHSVSSYRFDKEREKMPQTPNNNTHPTNSPGSPSLKSKESALSVGGQSGASSDQSTNGPYVHVEVPDASASELMLGLGLNMNPKANMGGKKAQQQQRKLKLKKYKDNAEKVLSLFSSPKAAHAPGHGGLAQSTSNLNSNFAQHGSGGGTTSPSVQNLSPGGEVEAAQSQSGQGLQPQVQQS